MDQIYSVVKPERRERQVEGRRGGGGGLSEFLVSQREEV
jgi:hypothetical protein